MPERHQASQTNETRGATTLACPNCDGTNYHRRTTRYNDHKPSERWWCPDCTSAFRRPKKRPYGGRGKNLVGLAKRLDAADPEEAFR